MITLLLLLFCHHSYHLCPVAIVMSCVTLYDQCCHMMLINDHLLISYYGYHLSNITLDCSWRGQRLEKVKSWFNDANITIVTMVTRSKPACKLESKAPQHEVINVS